MSDNDKTLVIEPGRRQPDFGNCPVCNEKLQPDWENVELLRCPACHFTKKTVTIVEPGSIIAHKYRILSYLSGGGFGSIYICHPLDNMAVRYVLKVLKHPTQTSRRRFRREADILSSLTSNNRIARIVDYWEVENDTYIVMEYIDGSNLKQLQKVCQFDEYTVLVIGLEVALALQDIWNKYSIIHRDIKPENIMIDNDSHVKLLDFGLSKQCEDTSGNSNMITMENSSLGTPGFMSPEHFTNAKEADFRSDIYSLGATLFFLLTGHDFIQGNSLVDYYNQTIAFSPPPVEQFPGECSPGCVSLIRRMMQKNLEDRHNSYEELVAEINALLPQE